MTLPSENLLESKKSFTSSLRALRYLLKVQYVN